jgi:selenocysteine-specific elongation factor
VRHALKQLVERKKIRNTNEVLSIAGYDPFARLGERERKLIGTIEQAFLDCGLEPSSPQSVVGLDEANQAVYRLLLDAGRLVRLKTYGSSSDLVLHTKVLEGAKQAIERKFPYPAAFALKDVRDLLGSTRKYVVPLMEHFDATGATARSGDMRRLRERR